MLIRLGTNFCWLEKLSFAIAVLQNSFIDGFGNVIQISCVQAAHVDASGFQHVNVMICTEEINLTS